MSPTDAISETPVFFGKADELFGIFSAGDQTGDLGAVICATPAMSDNPVGALLARHLAASRIPAFRFDLPGHGESHEIPGHVDEGGGTGFLAAMEWMRNSSVQRFVLIGGSAGANAGLAAANQMTDLGGLVFNRLSTKRHLGKVGRAFRSSRGRPAAPTVVSQLQHVIELGVPMLMIRGAEDTDETRIRRLLEDKVPDLDRTSLQVTSVTTRTLKGFRSVPAQRQFVEEVGRWVRDLS